LASERELASYVILIKNNKPNRKILVFTTFADTFITLTKEKSSLVSVIAPSSCTHAMLARREENIRNLI
jgi:hypothetical protein